MSCGGGTRTKTRTKTVEELYDGTCDDVSYAVEVCNTDDCPSKIIIY